MKNYLNKIVLGLSFLVLVASCKKKKAEEPKIDDPVNPNPPELITTFQITFLDNATMQSKTYSFRDLDGDGGSAGVYGGTNQSDSVIELLSGHTYSAEVRLIDESLGKHDTISNAVAGDEAGEHLFFYNGNPSNLSNNKGNSIVSSANPYTIKTNGSNISIRYLDLDKGSPALPIGLKTEWFSLNPTSGIKYPLEFSLRHQPGAKNGTYSPGETDLELIFKVKIQ